MKIHIKQIKEMLKRIFWILMLIIVFCLGFYRCYFLRQPTRSIPNNENVFVSPANGEIIAIIENPTDNTVIYKDNNKVLDHFVDGIGSGATMVSIMMTPMNVHFQRSPANAVMIEKKYVHGKRRNAMKTDPTMTSTLQNEYNAMLFETDKGVRYRIVQIAGIVARRIESFIDVNQKVRQGEVIGLIKFGSQVTIIFDKNVEVIAKIGDKVIDGETVLGKLKENAVEEMN